jgi:LysR family transcriptional regulator, flagellar master operon regulator
MPAYVVYPLDCDRDLFGIALEIMHGVANSKATTTVARNPSRRSRRTR